MDDQGGWDDWLRELVHSAANRMGLRLIGEPSVGLRGRSIGRRVLRGDDEYWLRVVNESPEWATGSAWTGNADANEIEGIRRPRVLDVAEWDTHSRRARAELMTLTPGHPVSDETVARQDPALDDTWWADLRASLDTLSKHPTDRVCLEPEHARLRILAAFGVNVDFASVTWTTAHGDLHWANVTAPEFALLDWEAWGRAPAGYDAATLACTSLLQPTLAAAVRSHLSDLLDTPSGLAAQLAAAAKLLRLVEYGDHPDLAPVLHAEMHALLASPDLPRQAT